MSHIHSYWRTDRPAEGFYTSELAAEPVPVVDSGTTDPTTPAVSARPIRTFLPDGYEPRYPYPLLVLFHDRGGNEEQVLKLAPRVSRRNFLAISLRGPEVLPPRADGRPAFGWGPDDRADEVADYLVRAVDQTRRTYHVHTERVFLVGVGAGAAAAYRAAFALGDRVAGVAVLNGGLPRTPGRPLFRLDVARKLRVFIGHGVANLTTPYEDARRDQRIFYAAGAEVRLSAYPTTHRLHPDMLKDLNRWVIGRVEAEHELFVGKGR